MESAFAWLGKVAEWFGAFIPRWEIVDTTYGAVKIVRGKRVVPLGPGIHWYWPATTNYYRYPTARQSDHLPSQTFVTKDDKVIAVTGTLVSEVFDIEPLLAHTYQPAQTVKDIALSAVHDVCCKMDWEELKDGQRRGTLDTKLKNEAQKGLTPYGVKVLKLMLIDLSPARVLKIIQTVSKDGEEST